MSYTRRKIDPLALPSIDQDGHLVSFEPWRQRSSAPVQAKKRKAGAKQLPATGADVGEYLAQVFSDIELLVALDVIRSAISEGRKHVDLDALRGVLAKLTAAYGWKRRRTG